MQTPITVLMPNYNNAPFLSEAIDSILNQKFGNFIFLIIDDGSTDNSVEIIKSYTDKRIVLKEKSNNSGIVDSLNIGLEYISTRYAIRMDGDDISTKNRFEVLYNFMEKNPEVGVCGSQIQTFGNSNEVWKYSSDKNKIKAKLIFNGGVGHASCIFRMDIFKKHKIKYSNKHPYMEDYALFSNLKKHTEFGNIEQPLYKYRILEHNSTVKNRHNIFERYRNFYKDVLCELEIEPSEKNIDLHLEFFIKKTLSFKIKEYKQWLEYLILQNQKKKIYPERALHEVLKERWDIFFYKIPSAGIKKSFAYFIVSKKISPNKLLYLLKYNINKLTGRI